MDDNKMNNQFPDESKLTGFDSVSNINQEKPGVFNPTPMFSGQAAQEGYTVTPEGSFYSKPDAQPAPTQSTSPSAEPEPPVAPSQVSAEPAAPAQPTEPAEPAVAPVQPPVNPAPSFIPNGTYSYSAAKGNLPHQAFDPLSQPAPAPIPQPPKRVKVKKPKREKKYGIGAVIVAAVLAAVIGVGGGVGAFYAAGKLTATTPSTSSGSPTTVTTIKVDESTNASIEAVAKKAGPSIIGIRTTAAVTSFFGGSSEATEEGSGIIYSTDGYIITNYHVIQSAVESSNSKVEVFLPDDTKTALGATIVGYNIASDLAVVKINKTGLSAVEFADSDKLSVGQYAIAIGNPGGLEFIGSVSSGVISGLNRSVTVGTGSTMSLIQTDAAINPGNSGGALVNLSGQLIGVNSIKLVSESYEGMGFAIPANTVKQICNNIIAKQNDPTPYIGLQISQSYTAAQLSALGYPAGAVVVSVVEGGPASESGIQRGDIITEFNSKTISSYSDLDSAISDCTPGQEIAVKLYRSGRFYSTNVKVEANNAQ